jgi:hypothetical protein
MKWNKLYKYPKSITINNKRIRDTMNCWYRRNLPSVTTILSATESLMKKSEKLFQRWKAKVGEKEAERSQKYGSYTRYCNA